MNIIFPPSHEDVRRFSQRSLPPLPSQSPRASLVPTRVDSAVGSPSPKYPDIPKWPTTPQDIKHGGFFAVFGCLGNVLTIIVACAFFVFGGFVLKQDRMPLSDVQHLSILKDAARYGPTVFPIFLEAIVGQAVHALALCRLEHGERLKVLDQLLGSTSIFATVVTQFKYRNVGLLGTILLLLWSLSPIGGQASLRVLDFGVVVTEFNQTMHFLDMNSTFRPGDVGDMGELEGLTSDYTISSLYGAALLSPITTKMSSMDSWGNIKIPMIERLSNLTKDSEGWQSVGSNNQTIYSSLVGIPLTAISTDHATTFYMETSYFSLDCPVLLHDSEAMEIINSNVDAFNGTDLLPGWDGAMSLSWALATPVNQYSTPEGLARIYGNGTNMAPRKLYYESYDDDQSGTYAECNLTTSYVEARTVCNGRNCTVTHMRPSTQPHIAPAWTVADGPKANVFFPYFQAAVSGNSYKPTTVQRYLWNPADAFNNTRSGLALYKLGQTDFSVRFAQLLNSYWMAGIGLNLIPGGLPTELPGGPVLASALRNGSTYGEQTRATTATISTSTPVLRCNKPWLAALFIATGIMCLTGVLGLVLELTRKTPDLAINLSSFARDNPYIHLPPGGSALESATRGRLMQNVRVRFGDVKAGEPVGHIAIASCGEGDEEGEVTRLKGGRRMFA